MEKGTLIYKCPLLVVFTLEIYKWKWPVVSHNLASISAWASLAKEPGHLPMTEFVAAGKKHTY